MKVYYSLKQIVPLVWIWIEIKTIQNATKKSFWNNEKGLFSLLCFYPNLSHDRPALSHDQNRPPASPPPNPRIISLLHFLFPHRRWRPLRGSSSRDGAPEWWSSHCVCSREVAARHRATAGPLPISLLHGAPSGGRPLELIGGPPPLAPSPVRALTRAAHLHQVG